MTLLAVKKIQKHMLFIFLLALCSVQALAKTYSLSSPNNELNVTVDLGKKIFWSVDYKSNQVITPGAIGLVLNKAGDLTLNAKLVSVTRETVSGTVEPVIAQKSSVIREYYNQLSFVFENGLGLEMRAYNDGVAYRFLTTLETSIQVEGEILELNFPANTTSLFPEEEALVSHYERLYVNVNLAEVAAERFASLPIYMNVNESVSVVFTEADLFDYPGLFLYGTMDNGLTAGFPGYVSKATPMKGAEDRNQVLVSEDYIAKTQGHRSFPWRVAVISDRDGALVESQLVYLLSRENALTDTSWIKPGKVAWDWYNANNIYGVDFISGDNTETYKYYIDFAEKYHLDYIILDEGWTRTTVDTLHSNPNLNVKELVRYGKKKGVGVILWSLWEPLDKDYKNILATYASWGVAGIKVDFMQRADQYMVNYYEKIAREAAKHELLVDYHGAYKPAGLRRAYPNVISYEGVKGNENNKWSQDVTPEHNVTLPFIRMVAGPMDFTPGAMVNAQLENHKIVFPRPMSLGTRVHQVAMYAVYESALQMLCDTPSSYNRDHETADFISHFPTVWDETQVLDAKVADYILVARRSGNDWYIGAMTDWTPRELVIDFSFLEKGEYRIDYMEDGVNASRYAQDYNRKSAKLSHKDEMKIKLAPGGGWAAIVSKE